MNNFDFYRKNYPYFLPVMPFLINSFNPPPSDLVISTSHCIAKSFPKPEGSIHISYVHSPMRYIYDQFPHYFGPNQAKPAVRAIMQILRPYLALWDRSSNDDVDYFIANSKHVAKRIRKYWNRSAEVIYPPVDVETFTPSEKFKVGEYYLIVSALVAYKRIDLAIRAANRLKKNLLVVGGGSDEAKLRAIAGPTVEFRSWTSPAKLVSIIRGCKAFVFPGEEDFGISPVEAMACGKPVIAYGVGGVTETVLGDDKYSNPTGRFFRSQTVESMIEAMESFRPEDINPEACRERALQFSADQFNKNMTNFIDKVISSNSGINR